jgi:hypothetical protein
MKFKQCLYSTCIWAQGAGDDGIPRIYGSGALERQQGHQLSIVTSYSQEGELTESHQNVKKTDLHCQYT